MISKLMRKFKESPQSIHHDNMTAVEDKMNDGGYESFSEYFTARNEVLNDWLFLKTTDLTNIKTDEIVFSTETSEHPYTIESGVKLILNELEK